MTFDQTQFLIGSTHLAVRTKTLYVCQRNPQGRIMLETEIPYEDLLPLDTKVQRQVPAVPLLLAGGMLLLLGYGPWTRLLTTGHPTTDFWLWLGILALNVGSFWLRFERQWSTFRLRTARLVLTLAGRPWQRRRFAALVLALETQTHTYLRREYGRVNPLGWIEPQLRRLRWLRDLEVLSPREAQALTTRLTGQTGAAWRGLGKELEPLYVN